MSRHGFYARMTVSASLICLIALMVSFSVRAEGDAACNVASLINPNNLDGGMGGSGSPARGGTGGTGIDSEHGGMGGTGIDSEHGGMDGTSVKVENTLLPVDAKGSVSIVGVVTGFASICVNGVEVHYDNNTPVFDNGKQSKLSELAVGKMVMLKADRIGARMQAQAIGMFDAVAGPVGRVDVGRHQIQVMGQTVRVDQNTIQQMNSVPSGAKVRVSGHRLENGEIVATRVDVVKGTDVVSTLGLVTGVAKDGFLVSGTRVNIDNRKVLDTLNVGSEVRVGGAWDGKAIKADRVEVQPIKTMMSRSDAAIVEGFFGSRDSNKLSVYGTEVQLSQGKTGDKNVDESKVVKIEMRREKNGEWVADKVEARKGKLFEKDLQFKNEIDPNNGGNSSKGGDKNKTIEIKSDNNSSGSNSGSSSSGGRGTSNGSSGRSGSSSNSSGGHGSSNGPSDGHGSSGSSSGGSGSSNRSGNSGGGKYK